jgi:hypothetical protein
MAEDPSHVKQLPLDHVCKIVSCNVGTVSALEVLVTGTVLVSWVGYLPLLIACSLNLLFLYDILLFYDSAPSLLRRQLISISL